VLLLASEFTKIMGFGCWGFIYTFLTGILFFRSFCYSEKGMVLSPCILSIHITYNLDICEFISTIYRYMSILDSVYILWYSRILYPLSF
jgi:hypothetical protein